MSWSLNVIGSPRAVCAQVEQDRSIPESVKELVRNFTKPGPSHPGAVHLETHGHYDSTGNYSCITKLIINPVKLAPEPAEPEHVDTAAAPA